MSLEANLCTGCPGVGRVPAGYAVVSDGGRLFEPEKVAPI